MRYEYLHRFAPKYGDGGFNRLMNDGFYLRNAHYNYIPTRTAPGHASVYTGSTPAIHGIIANEWYDRTGKIRANCVTDPRYKPVGSSEGRGDVSPWRLLSTTVTDELKIFTQKKSKVIGIALKDRGAVLPAGHMPDAAYWFDNKSGNFITSTYYLQALPGWVEKFNARKLPDQYLSNDWNTLYPIDQYTESGPDNNPYESKLFRKQTPTFPYKLKELKNVDHDYDMLQLVPYGNDFTLEMFKAAVEGEELGQGDRTDFLALSFSTPDKMGHEMGPNAIEMEDIYLRLDKNLEDMLHYLDTKVGKEKYMVFLTADHGVPDIAKSQIDNRIPSGYYNSPALKDKLNALLKQYFPKIDVVEAVENEQVFFNREAFQADPKAWGVEFRVATELVINFLLQEEGVANAYSENLMRQSHYDEGGIKGMMIRGFNPKRSGDVLIAFEPGWYELWKITYADHGSGYSYDTHVPVIFYGSGIKKGSSVKYHPITDIAATLSTLLHIKLPGGCTGRPIEELFEN